MKKNVIFGISVIVIGIALIITSLVIAVSNLLGESIKFTTPNVILSELEEGSYTVYYEHESVLDGQVFSTSTEDVSGLILRVVGEDERDIIIGPSNGSSNYTINNRQGYSILSFDIMQLGNYHIITEHDKTVVLNINKVDIFAFIKYILLSIVIFIITIIIALISFTRKSKVKDELYDEYS
jgi:hypothetical protein